MKLKNSIIRTASFLFIILLLCSCATAVSTGFQLEDNNKDLTEYADDIELTYLQDEPSKKEISCFDVNKHENIALGFENSEKKTVCVYNNNFEFLYGYSFTYSGSFKLDLDNSNNSLVYLVRDDIALTLNSNGNLLKIATIPLTEENRKYWRELSSPIRNVGSQEYRIQNDLGILSIIPTTTYGQLIKTNNSGADIILYDTTSSQIVRLVVITVLVIVFVVIAIVVNVKKFISIVKNRRL